MRKIFTILPIFLITILIILSRHSSSLTKTTISGDTMGTFYRVIYWNSKDSQNLTPVKLEIQRILNQVILIASNYDEHSEISKLNSQPKDINIPLSTELETILTSALTITDMTDGAFDITSGKLVNLWGFGPDGSVSSKPSPQAIQSALENTGSQLISISQHSLLKSKDRININLSGIAKGYAVDQISSYLSSLDIKNHLIDIGGELVAKGLNNGKNWKIAVETPTDSTLPNPPMNIILETTNLAVATSGNYHQYKIVEDLPTHHIIDPRTGYPSNSNLLSVTVLGSNCMRADAMATGLMILGSKKGLDVIEKVSDLEALFILKPNKENQPQILTSSGFPLSN